MDRTGGSACPGKGGYPAVSLQGPGRVSAEGLPAGLSAGPRSRAVAGDGEGAGRDPWSPAKPLRVGRLRRPWAKSISNMRQKCGAKGTTLSTLRRIRPATVRLAMTKSRVFPESIAASLLLRISPLADAAMLAPANLSRSTFQSPATTQLGICCSSASSAAMMVILGSAWSPVLDWRYTETITSRHCTLGNSIAMKPHPSTQNDWTRRGWACQGVATTRPPFLWLACVAPAQKE